MASHWSPEDDFRLRKSIENGASLESLAKGAVNFSRKFTLSELTDRWHSLLYSPQVTSLSSSLAFDLEYSDRFLPQTRHTTPVRSQYYTARKRMRVEEPLHAEISPVAFRGLVFDGSDDLFDLDFNESDLEIFHNSFPGIMHQQDYDANDEMLVNQLLNIDDGQIHQGCDVADTTIPTLEHVLLQEEFQDPLFQQPNTSLLSEALPSVSRHQVTPAQTDTWDLPIEPELCRLSAMSLSELDPHPEINEDGVIICVLNQECTDIPDNDDIDLQPHRPKARNSVNPSSSSSSRRHMNPHLPPIRGSTSSSQAKGNNGISHSYGFGDCAATTQASCSFKDGFAEKATSSFTATASTSQQHSPETEIYEQLLSTEMNINGSMSEGEENHNEIESDEDLPSFSDVEAMVLDMDLESIGQGQYELEASKYRNEEIVRKMIRLEQSSTSYMNRDIASHGAFAILYGSSKHYINKPEVLLGRATGEYPVDIDLASSGSGTKVSRRQALIMLKQDGCFEIKNLGKFPIWISEKEAGHGEVVNLKNNSLIQIRGMSFVFETNEREVRRYLDGNS